MANPQNVELEAAKFLHKLIQESKDEPSKLATKLYVVCHNFPESYCCFCFVLYAYVIDSYGRYMLVKQILQHMRSSGKENSMPYQVISR